MQLQHVIRPNPCGGRRPPLPEDPLSPVPPATDRTGADEPYAPATAGPRGTGRRVGAGVGVMVGSVEPILREGVEAWWSGRVDGVHRVTVSVISSVEYRELRERSRHPRAARSWHPDPTRIPRGRARPAVANINARRVRRLTARQPRLSRCGRRRPAR